MLPKNQRLNLKKDFKWVAQGQKKESAHFKLFFRLGENLTPLVGIAISSKSFPKAHDRARAKRRVAQAARLIYQNLPRGLNLVIMPRVSVFEQSPDSLAEQITDHVKGFYKTY